MTLGTKIGVGSIIGTTMSICIGGCGSILWMWIFTLITSSIIYYESIIGTRYKKAINKDYVGGPFFYIKEGLNNKIIAIIMIILLVCTCSFFFQIVQTNTVASLILINTNFNIIILSIIIFIILILTVFFSLKELKDVLNKIVPIMCILFLIISSYIVIKNISFMPQVIKVIINDFFSIKGLLVGSLIGIKRSIFLNELLIGTTSISSSVDMCDEDTSASSQVIGSYFITFLVSTLIAFIIIIFKINNNVFTNDYIELINNVFIYHLDTFGSFILIILVSLFAFSTSISGFYIGLSNLSYITKNKIILFIFRLLVIIFSMSGLYLSTDKIWNIIDIILPLILIINVFSITKLSKKDNLH